MTIFKNLIIKNFMSIGEIPQTVGLDNNGLTIILGQNDDTKNESISGRNGCGKSTIRNALCFALFGQSLTNDIKKDSLVNCINKKNMLVVVDFEKDGNTYRIERGRKPNILKFYNNDKLLTNDNDEAQGENKDTQEEIERVIGLSHTMFKNIVTMNTETIPFLMGTAAQQRDFIEELLHISKLSEKADKIKEDLKNTKLSIKEEEVKINTLKQSNDKLMNNINDLRIKSESWEKNKTIKIDNLSKEIEALLVVDIEHELYAFENNRIFSEKMQKLSKLQNDRNSLQSSLLKEKKRYTAIENELLKISENTCPTCNQSIDDIAAITEKYTKTINEIENEIKKIESSISPIDIEISEIQIEIKSLSKIDSNYKSEREIYEHSSRIETIGNRLQMEMESTNPYTEQIDLLLNKSISEISYDRLKELELLQNHQEFLVKLLTNKDSFVRKRIIDQNLIFLNNRLKYYLEQLYLPHEISFLNDMTVEIMNMGHEMAFSQLSGGEKTRLILSLSWAFRDIYEALHNSINLMFIDELLDSGLDAIGIEASYNILKDKARDGGKSVFLISHREELMNKCDNVIIAHKSGGFTTLEDNNSL